MESRQAPSTTLPPHEDIRPLIPVVPDADLPHGIAVPETVAISTPVDGAEPPAVPVDIPVADLTPAAAASEPTDVETAADTLEEDSLTIAMIDDSVGLRQRARDLADARLASETQSGGGFRGLLRRVWKGSIANEYYRQKYFHQSLEELHDQDSIFGGNTRASHAQSINTVERFISQYEADTVHRDAGERKVTLDDSPEGQQIKNAVKELIRQFAQGNIDDEGFQAERVRLLDELSSGNPALMGEGLLFADNLLDIAEQVRARAEAGASLEDTLARMQFVVGEARTGVRTEAQLNRADRLVQRLHDTKYGSLVNESTIGLAVGAGLAVTKTLTQKTIGRALAIPGFTGLATGLFAGLRESKRLKQERAQHSREMAQGGQVEGQSRRRDRMEQFRVETVSAVALGQAIEALIGTDGEPITITSEEQADELLRAVGEASNRKRLSNQQGIDYLSYSDVTAVEGERTYLDTLLGQAKAMLREYVAANPDSVIAQNGGLDAVLDDMLLSFYTIQDRQNQELDARFNRFRRKTALKAAAVGTAVGAAMGFAIQESMAHFPGDLGERHAGIGETSRPGDHKTLLAGLGLGGDEELSFQTVGYNSPSASHSIGSHLGLKIPDGWNFDHQGNTLNILDADGKSVHNLSLTSEGTLTPESIAQLKDSGDVFNQIAGHNPNGAMHELVPGGKGQIMLPDNYSIKNIDATHSLLTDADGNTFTIEFNEDGSITAASVAELEKAGFSLGSRQVAVAGPVVDYPTNGNGLVFANADQTRFIHRTDWYDNKTPSVFDKNELRAWAGGQNGSWFDKDGNVVIDVTRMTPDGSYNKWHSVDPFKANAAGNLRLGVSVTRDSQAHIFDFQFQTQPDGRVIAVIPKDSPVHQLFQMDANGKRVYNGKYFEVLEDTGTISENGAANVRPLATYVGREDATPFVAKVPTTDTHTITSLMREPQEIVEILGRPEAPVGIPIDTFPIIPLRSRAGLERLAHREEYYGYAGYYTSESLQRLKREISPRLRNNPDAQLNPAEELSWYRKELKRKRGRSYVRSIDRAIADSPELSNLPSSTRMMVVIPVRGSTEAENIGDVLSLYAQQDEASLRDTTILLNVNYTDQEVADSEAMEKVNATLAAIEAARQRFPQLKIAVIKQELKTEEITGRGRGAIGLVARQTYDTAMMAVEQAIRKGIIPADQDVMLLRKDADELGMSSVFLKSYLEAAEKAPETDVFNSLFRLQTDLHRRFPGMAIAHRFETSLEAANLRVAEARGEPGHAKTRGVAIGVRMATLAAAGSIGFSSYTGAGSDDLSVGKRIFGARSRIATMGSRGYSRSRGSFSPLTPGTIGAVPTARKVISRVPQAELDTHAGRLVSRYQSGLPMVGAWSDFSAGGGYRPRNAAVSGGGPIIDREDVAGDPVGVAKRVAMQISASSSLPNNDRRAVSLALQRLFARNRDDSGEPIYTVHWKGGECRFEFTDAGVKWLQNYLLRDSKGRFDNLGGRTRRKLYNEATGAKLPRRAEPLMVQRV